jgi:hypothetical protein
MSSKPSSRRPIFREERAAFEQQQTRERAQQAAARLRESRGSIVDDATVARRRSSQSSSARPAAEPDPARPAASASAAERPTRTTERASTGIKPPRISLRSVGDDEEEPHPPAASARRERVESVREHVSPPRSHPMYAYRPPPPHHQPPTHTLLQPGSLALVALVSIIIILLTQAPAQRVFSNFLNRALPPPSVVVRTQPDTPPGEHSVVGAPSVSPEQIDSVLAKYGSPAAGTGRAWVELGQQYGIDPAYALAFFIHESSAGTNQGWAGIKPDGTTTHNIGNIICAGYATCFGRFRDYSSWEEGIEDWYRLIQVEYIDGRGAHTIEQIVPIYAPSVENNVPAYVQAVTNLVNEWQGTN